eukprot:5813159-Prymnesium_polylepis.1
MVKLDGSARLARAPCPGVEYPPLVHFYLHCKGAQRATSLDPERKGHIVYVPYLNRITTAYHLQFQESKLASFSGPVLSFTARVSVCS